MTDRSDRPLGVWILNHYAHPRDLPGGSPHYDLGVELVRRGNQIVVFSSSFDHFNHEHVRRLPPAGWTTERVVGRSVRRQHPPGSEGEVQRIVLDAEKARHQLGWHPTVSLDDCPAQTLAWVQTTMWQDQSC